MNKTIEDAIRQLEEEILSKQAALRELKRMTGVHYGSNSYNESDVVAEKESSLNKDFPIDGRKDQKIMYLFNYVISNGVRMSDLQEFFNQHNKEYEKVSNVVRRLKDGGELVAIKYNNQNKLTFWGLPEWVNKDEQDFKSDFAPKRDLLPIKITSHEIILTKDEEEKTSLL
ncbi:hypothetical protein [Flagellimonas sp. SN16]|uniref:hypothetical protein n=1 Tax=Flagellimonas sp. SN16 TaxID=3415142 RepID=UPI003C532EBE